MRLYLIGLGLAAILVAGCDTPAYDFGPADPESYPTVVGISREANLAAVRADCFDIAWHAQIYYYKPALKGGGDSSFLGLTLWRCGWKASDNPHGHYQLSHVTSGSVVVTGQGWQNNSVTLTVYPDSISIPVIIQY